MALCKKESIAYHELVAMIYMYADFYETQRSTVGLYVSLTQRMCIVFTNKKSHKISLDPKTEDPKALCHMPLETA